jgi:Phosphodiester glycosidase
VRTAQRCLRDSIALCAISLLVVSATALGGQTTTHPFVGITFTEDILENPPLRLYWLRADLTNPAVHVRVCPGGPPDAGGFWETTLLPVSKIARRDHLDIAVNGSYFVPKSLIHFFGWKDPYFEGNPAKVCGWAVSDGRLWSDHPISPNLPALVVADDGSVSIGRFSAAPVHVRQVVSGCAMLVDDGRVVGPDDKPAPRCAAGLDAECKTLTLLVVDGRRPDSSVGLSMKQTAQELLIHGCWKAICLDSGGSATMVVRKGETWPVINKPSDGHDLLIPLSIERPVANALGIVIDPPATSH